VCEQLQRIASPSLHTKCVVAERGSSSVWRIDVFESDAWNVNGAGPFVRAPNRNSIRACLDQFPDDGDQAVVQRDNGYVFELRFDDGTMSWIRDALTQSHADERRDHEAAIARLRAEYDRLQNRVHAAYVDKLDGRIDAAFFDRVSEEWRREQEQYLRDIEQHQGADQSYLDEGVQLLELARNAQRLFAKQEAKEKRRLLGFLVSNFLLSARFFFRKVPVCSRRARSWVMVRRSACAADDRADSGVRRHKKGSRGQSRGACVRDRRRRGIFETDRSTRLIGLGGRDGGTTP
jgi:hypothetical protein